MKRIPPERARPAADRPTNGKAHSQREGDAWRGRDASDMNPPRDGRGMSTRDYHSGYDPQHDPESARGERRHARRTK